MEVLEKKTMCHICGVQLQDRKGLSLHIHCAHSGIQFPCDVCNRTYKLKSRLARHKLIHAGREPYCCQYCPKKFVVFQQFRRHVLTHCNVKNFKCDMCNKHFSCVSNVVRHVKTVHSTPCKKFICDECGASFQESKNLKRHSIIHLREKPFVCQFCGKQCTQASNLKIHIVGVHKDKSHLVYTNKQNLKLDPSSVVIPTYKDYTNKNKSGESKNHSNKKTVDKNRKCKNVVKKTNVQQEINNKDNYFGNKIEESKSDETGEASATDVCSGGGSGSNATTINSKDVNTQPNDYNGTVDFGFLTFSKSQNIPIEWNETRECKVVLDNCCLEIPIKNETGSPLCEEANDFKIPKKEESLSWGDTDNFKIPKKEELPSWNDTNNLKIPIKEESLSWDSTSDTKLYEYEINSKCENVKSTKESIIPVYRNQFKYRTLSRTMSPSSRQNQSYNNIRETDPLNPDTVNKCETCKHCSKKLTKHAMKVHLRNTHNICWRCDRVFNNTDELTQHFTRFCCKYCDKSFDTQYFRDKHLPEHGFISKVCISRVENRVKNNLESCKHCDKEFTKVGMKVHLHNAHNICGRCDRVFINGCELKQHLARYCCKYCDESFSSWRSSNKHQIEHGIEPKIFICDLCGIKFMWKDYLQRHILIHHSPKKHECQQCPKKYSIMKELKLHILMVHSQYKPFKCQFCPKIFTIFQQLKKHSISHTKNKSYMCHICSKCYPTKCSLTKHIDNIHMNIRKYKCEICSASFHEQSKLKRHIRIHSNVKPYKCQFCGKECTQAGNLKIHIMGVHRDVSHQVYKKTEATKQVDPNSVIIPTNSKQYFQIFPSS